MNLIPAGFPTSNQLTFLVLAGIAALMAVGVVVMPNPVRAAVCLVVNFFVLAFIYFTLSAQMLGITQILVYTGAIMVLFLFVIMLLNLGGVQKFKERFDVKPAIGALFGAALLGIVGSQVLLPFAQQTMPKADPTFGNPQSIGKVLMTSYVWPFEVISILLLVGIVGSIMLAKRRI